MERTASEILKEFIASKDIGHRSLLADELISMSKQQRIKRKTQLAAEREQNERFVLDLSNRLGMPYEDVTKDDILSTIADILDEIAALSWARWITDGSNPEKEGEYLVTIESFMSKRTYVKTEVYDEREGWPRSPQFALVAWMQLPPAPEPSSHD